MQGALHGLNCRLRILQCGTVSAHPRPSSTPGRRQHSLGVTPCLGNTTEDTQPSSSVSDAAEDAEARRLRRQALRQTRQAGAAAPAPAPAEQQQASASTQQEQQQPDARSSDGASTSGSSGSSSERAAATAGGKSSVGNRRAAARARTRTQKGPRAGSATPTATATADATTATEPGSRSASRSSSSSSAARKGAARAAAPTNAAGVGFVDEQQDEDGPFGMAAAAQHVQVDGDDAGDDELLLEDEDLADAAGGSSDDDGDEFDDEDGGDDADGASTSGGAAVQGLESSEPPRAKRKKQWRPSEQMVLGESHPMYVPVLTDDDLAEDPPGHKSGYVAIIGRPNAGKSTLINAIVGQKLSIVTFKAQTTRHRVVGIASEPNYQMILFDTPGIVRQQRNALEERMMAAVVSSIRAAEAIIAVVDAGDSPKDALAMFQPGSDWNGPPMAVLLNKADLLQPEELEELSGWYKTNCRAQEVFSGSALTGSSNEAVAAVKAWAVEKLPEGPTLYPKDMVSEQPERFFVSEIIREKIFLQYEQEIPYCVQVTIPEFKERPGQKDYISASILVERDTQKGIIIGAGGAGIKKLGAAARTDIEAFLERPVYLELRVEVAPDWRNKNDSLKNFGFYDPLYIT